ncbi:release factor glutamine methyltransferase [Enterococcus sp. PF1-24]|uniref:peptide chain release factor N(5)-glutamine methyltransferase n=1 Tax=unclassified Enterococcus TaxID=2608891 RepID=UPI0024771E78|nr:MULTISPECIES: peptide chain release factor N(5)-glutamine methyltransferase [unclassified Enterococcus]MDH6365383.1 release factor glutamine methyltransferase [Enterococcus sp. PFB1-1]MDH6402484.1 release factor glutamine methyltransferase [Enterococcus sp. PF1-24]
MAKQTYREVLLRASSFLEEAGIEGYSIQYLFLERKGWRKIDWLLQLNQEITEADQIMIENDLQQLAKHYPPDYLLGYSTFYDRKFKVNEATLIPRPETEELVALCLQENPQENLTVVDIGTGSGAIAITLKAEQPSWQVAASDISAATLMVAEENAEKAQTPIDFRLGSVLTKFSTEKFDIIVANPPYISEDEWDLMDESVRQFEPKTALFAENNGLAIYQEIALAAQQHLKPTGKIYLEIGFQQGAAVTEIFQRAFPDKIVAVKQDMAGKDRIVVIHNVVDK